LVKNSGLKTHTSKIFSKVALKITFLKETLKIKQNIKEYYIMDKFHVLIHDTIEVRFDI